MLIIMFFNYLKFFFFKCFMCSCYKFIIMLDSEYAVNAITDDDINV